MKCDLCSKAAIVAFLFSSHASTAKSFVPNPPIKHHHGIGIQDNRGGFKRPYHNAFQKSVKTPVIASRTSRTSEQILSLRAGGGVSLLTICTSSLNTFFKQNPYAAAFFICGLQASAADYITQKTSQMKLQGKENAVEVRGGTHSASVTSLSRPSFELKRNLAFLLYGGIYQGCFQEHLFNKIFPVIFGEGNGLLTVALKVAFDMLIVSPFLCLPVAYLIKGLIYRLSIMDSIQRYVHDVRENGLLRTYWSIWWPVQAFNFMLVPKQFRISFIACFSFMWLMILSAISGKSEAKTA